MTRYEFIDRLRAALTGEIPASVVEDNIRFYDRYISDEIAKGKSEEEVLAGLGDARLIARTILETWRSDDTDLEYQGSAEGDGGSTNSHSSYEEQGRYRTTQIYEETYQEDSRGSDQTGSYFGMNGKVYRLDKWYLKLIPIAIILLVFAVIFFVLFGVMKLTFTILTSPIFWGILLVMGVVGWFSRRR